MKAEYPRRPPTNENLYEYFLSRARANLHVVLCFSPVGEKFQNRALKFPGKNIQRYYCYLCYLIWFLTNLRHIFIAFLDVIFKTSSSTTS